MKSATEQRPEPDLVYFRRTHRTAPVELIIVENGHSTIWPVSPERLLQLVANGAGFLATMPVQFGKKE